MRYNRSRKNNFSDISTGDDSILIQTRRYYILQQVELLFDTTPNDVFGDTNFGTEFGKYLWNLKVSNYDLENIVQTQLSNIDLCGYSTSVEVQLYQGTLEDIAIINIQFYDTQTQDKFSETWKIS